MHSPLFLLFKVLYTFPYMSLWVVALQNKIKVECIAPFISWYNFLKEALSGWGSGKVFLDIINRPGVAEAVL